MLLQDYVATHFKLATVVTANPLKALEIMVASPPVLIITDLNHPHLSGEDFIRWARRTCPTVPILVVTGDTELRQEYAIKAGADRSISAPYRCEEIVSEVEHLLRISRENCEAGLVGNEGG